jgi:hypothetical protein
LEGCSVPLAVGAAADGGATIHGSLVAGRIAGQAEAGCVGAGGRPYPIGDADRGCARANWIGRQGERTHMAGR